MHLDQLLEVLADAGHAARLVSGQSQILVCHEDCGDTTGHLYISAENGAWICHRCEAKGGPFALLTEVCGMEPFDAWRKLPALFQADKDRPNRYLPRGRYLPVEKVEAEISLPEEFIPDLGKGLAARYLESRGLSANLCKQYGLGYCLQGKYAHRVIVPVYTESKLRTFVARTWLPDAKPKVLTAKDSNASSALFNFDAVRPPVCVLVEGVFDAMRIPQVGIATLGLHTSERQRNLLRDRGFTDIVLLRDADEAGQRAAASEAFELGASFFKVYLAALPEGQDPASSTVGEILFALDRSKLMGVDCSRNLVSRKGDQ